MVLSNWEQNHKKYSDRTGRKINKSSFRKFLTSRIRDGYPLDFSNSTLLYLEFLELEPYIVSLISLKDTLEVNYKRFQKYGTKIMKYNPFNLKNNDEEAIEYQKLLFSSYLGYLDITKQIIDCTMIIKKKLHFKNEMRKDYDDLISKLSPRSQILKRIRNQSQHSSLILGELHNVGDFRTGEVHILLGAEFLSTHERCKFSVNEINFIKDHLIEMKKGNLWFQPINLWKLIITHYEEYSNFLITYVENLKEIIKEYYRIIIEPYSWASHFSSIP